jgi:HEAT repeat protein
MFAFVATLAVAGVPWPATAQVPGPESFAREPRTPSELWNAIDYLMRTDQSPKALPYLDRFLAANPDDATLIAIRDRFGSGSFLRLADHPATARYAKPLIDRLNVAARRHATRPDRLERFVAALAGSPDEQDYAVARLQEAGAEAVPFVIKAIEKGEPGSESRDKIVRNMGRLDSSAVPALVAVLDSPDPALAADAATAMGQIGDPRAVPFLTFPAASSETPPALREAARRAIARLTGRPHGAEGKTPSRVLTDAAWRYHRHQVEFPGDPVILWSWDRDRKVPVPTTMPRADVEEALGKRLASEALRLQPDNTDARLALLSLTLERAVGRVGLADLATKDAAAFDAARKAGPEIVAQVLRRAIADNKSELAAASATVLGAITDVGRLSADNRPHPLVEALSAPGRRVQFAAARALVNLNATRPYPGSSALVPTLARFASSQSVPRAVVIDGNPLRGSQLAGFLSQLGYETTMERTGSEGFRVAAQTADVEIVLVSHVLHQGPWDLIDTLTNLEHDARTARLPVFVYGPYALQMNRLRLLESFPGVKYVVQPLDAATLEHFLGGRPTKLSDAERAGYAKEAAALLAKLTAQPNSPYASDLNESEPALTFALSQPPTALSASAALGDVPLPDAQRSLGDIILDPSLPPELRRNSAERLTHSIRRFGALLSGDQERAILTEMQATTDPQLRAAIGQVIDALRAQSPAGGRNPRTSPAQPSAGANSGTPARAAAATPGVAPPTP